MPSLAIVIAGLLLPATGFAPQAAASPGVARPASYAELNIVSLGFNITRRF